MGPGTPSEGSCSSPAARGAAACSPSVVRGPVSARRRRRRRPPTAPAGARAASRLVRPGRAGRRALRRPPHRAGARGLEGGALGPRAGRPAEAWTPDGALLVSRPGAGDVVELRPSGAGAPAQRTLVDGLDQPHGLAFDGSTLYVAESDRIDAYTLRAAGGLRPAGGRRRPPRREEPGTARRVRARPQERGRRHATGGCTSPSAARATSPPRTAAPTRSGRRSCGYGRAAAPPEVYARGVRNGTGLAVDPDGRSGPRSTTATTSPTRTRRTTTATDRPTAATCCRRTSTTTRWSCSPGSRRAATSAGRTATPIRTSTPAPRTRRSPTRTAPTSATSQTNADGSKLDCAALPPVEQGLGAHSAPLGLAFVRRAAWPAAYRQGALVGVHGSWNRNPPRAPEVSFFPWRGGTLGAQQTLLGGFQAPDGDRWGRPVMAVAGRTAPSTSPTTPPARSTG